jgi:hypothetical protein
MRLEPRLGGRVCTWRELEVALRTPAVDRIEAAEIEVVGFA